MVAGFRETMRERVAAGGQRDRRRRPAPLVRHRVDGRRRQRAQRPDVAGPRRRRAQTAQQPRLRKAQTARLPNGAPARRRKSQRARPSNSEATAPLGQYAFTRRSGPAPLGSCAVWALRRSGPALFGPCAVCSPVDPSDRKRNTDIYPVMGKRPCAERASRPESPPALPRGNRRCGPCGGRLLAPGSPDSPSRPRGQWRSSPGTSSRYSGGAAPASHRFPWPLHVT